MIARRHGDFVFRALGRFGVADPDLTDMAHEVFVVAIRRADQLRSVEQAKPWLYGIARRVAAAYRRRAHRRYEQASDTIERVSISDGSSPEDQAAISEARATLVRILERMSLDQRAAFVMFELEGMTGAEIATAIGVPVQTVFSRLRRARAIFEREVAQRRGRP